MDELCGGLALPDFGVDLGDDDGFLDLARPLGLGRGLLIVRDDLLDRRGARRGLLGRSSLVRARAFRFLRLELGELLLGRQLLPLGGDDELQVRPSRR